MPARMHADCTIRPGDRVRITGGPYAGKTGLLRRESAKGLRVLLHIAPLIQTVISVSRGQVERVGEVSR